MCGFIHVKHSEGQCLFSLSHHCLLHLMSKSRRWTSVSKNSSASHNTPLLYYNRDLHYVVDLNPLLMLYYYVCTYFLVFVKMEKISRSPHPFICILCSCISSRGVELGKALHLNFKSIIVPGERNSNDMSQEITFYQYELP